MSALELLASLAAASIDATETVVVKSPTADLIRIAQSGRDPTRRRGHGPISQRRNRSSTFGRSVLRGRALLKSFHKAKEVREGRETYNLYGALKEEIEGGRDAFRKEFIETCPSMVDYFHLELQRTLARVTAALLVLSILGLCLWAQAPVSLPDSVADYRAFLAAQQFYGSGEFQKVVDALKPVWKFQPISPLIGKAAILAAQSYEQLGQYAEALELLRNHAERLPQPDGWLLLARNAEAASDTAGAAAYYQRLFYSYPTSDQAVEAEAALDRLKTILGAELSSGDAPNPSRTGRPVGTRWTGRTGEERIRSHGTRFRRWAAGFGSRTGSRRRLSLPRTLAGDESRSRCRTPVLDARCRPKRKAACQCAIRTRGASAVVSEVALEIASAGHASQRASGQE